MDRDTISVSVLPGITAINFNQTNIRCNGGNDGSLTAIPVGGVAPYNYSWSNNNTGPTIGSLLVGTYTVTITNGQTCSLTASAIILQPLPLAVANMIVQNASNLLNNGSIEVQITGGTMPYHYQWLNLDNTPIGGATDSVATSLYGPFYYKVRVIDANGCSFISSPIFVDNTSGTNEPSLASQIDVFPNPSTGKFYLRFNLLENDDAQIEAYDMLGRLLIHERKQVAPGDIVEMDFSEMPSSIYLLKINMKAGGLMTKNISVKK